MKLNRILEKLIPANINELDIAMEKDSELKRFITTKGKDLPQNYLNLFDEIAPNALEEGDLYYLIEQSIRLNFKCLFSVSNVGAYEGFIAYQINGNNVTAIKMFSLKLDHKDFSFQENLKELISDILLPKYDKISWTAKKRNSANESYRRIIKEFNGYQTPPFDDEYSNISDDTIIRYCIEKMSIKEKI